MEQLIEGLKSDYSGIKSFYNKQLTSLDEARKLLDKVLVKRENLLKVL
jgi:hypothetical protein